MKFFIVIIESVNIEPVQIESIPVVESVVVDVESSVDNVAFLDLLENNKDNKDKITTEIHENETLNLENDVIQSTEDLLNSTDNIIVPVQADVPVNEVSASNNTVSPSVVEVSASNNTVSSSIVKVSASNDTESSNVVEVLASNDTVSSSVVEVSASDDTVSPSVVEAMVKEERSDMELNCIDITLDEVNAKMKPLDVSKGVPDANREEINQGRTDRILSDDDKTLTGDNSSRQSSFDLSDEFVDINLQTVNGAITAIVSEHIPIRTNAEVSPNKTITNEPNENVISENTVADEEVTSEGFNKELQKSLDETSRKNVFRTSSMELARENLFTMSQDDDSDSFLTARTDVTITDDTDTDNLSFFSTKERLTPTNDIAVSLPDLSLRSYNSQLDMDLTPTQDHTRLSTSGCEDQKRLSSTSFEDIKRRSSSFEDQGKLGSSSFEIQFIDEETNRVMSREALHSPTSVRKHKSSVGKETTV